MTYSSPAPRVWVRFDLPNVLTASRYLGSLLFWACAVSGAQLLILLAVPVLTLTYLTDVADGKIARRYGDRRHAPEGRVLDSAADTFTITIVFFTLATLDVIPNSIFVMILTGRALLDVLRFVSLARGARYPNPSGLTKAKGLVYGIASVALYAGWAVDSFGWARSDEFRTSTMALLILMTVIACGQFLIRYRFVLVEVFAATQSTSAFGADSGLPTPRTIDE